MLLLPLTVSRVAFLAQPFPSDDAATAFQFLATIIVSFALVVVFVAALSSPPTTGLLGLSLGIMLAVFSLFQMIAFSLVADLVAECETFASIPSFNAWFFYKIAWILAGDVHDIFNVESWHTTVMVAPEHREL